MKNLYKNIIFFGMSSILIFAPIARGAAPIRLWSITPVLLVLYFLIFLWLGHANNTSDYKFITTPLDKFIFLFIMLATTSFAFSIYKYESFYSLIMLFAYAGLYYLVVNEFDHTMIKRIIYLIICVAVSISVYGFMQYLGFFGHPWWNPKEFLASTFVNHNHFAGYLELVIPVTIGLLLTGGKGKRAPLVAASIIMLSIFILAQSRGGWISLSISLSIMAAIILKDRNNKKGVFVLILVILATLAILYSGRDIVSQRIESVTDMSYKDMSTDTRIKIWKGAIEIIKNNPLIGTGIGTFVWAFPRYNPQVLDVQANFAHNDYLETASDMGIFALLVMILLFANAIRVGFKNRKTNPLSLGCAIGILSLALHGMTDFNFHIPANMILFTTWMAIIVHKPGHSRRENS